MPEFSTERLCLSPATDDDLDALVAIWDDPEVRRFLFDNQPVTRERAAEVLANCFALWLVRLRDAAPVIGCVGLMPATTATEGVEPVAAFLPTVWGSGYATEALREIVRHAFEELAIPQLVAVNDVPNEASDRLARRLGFTVTGECDGPAGRLRTYTLARP